MRAGNIAIVAGGLVLAAGIVGILTVVGDGNQQALLEGREAAVRDTDMDALEGAFDALNASDVIAVLAEASYHRSGSGPVHEARGIAPPADLVGADAARVLDALRGAPVRFILVGQCEGTTAFTGGLALGEGTSAAGAEPPATISPVPFADSRVPCGQSPKVLLSGPYTLPPSDDTARQWVRLSWTPSDDHDPTVDRLVLLVAAADSPLPDRPILEATARQAMPPLHAVP